MWTLGEIDGLLPARPAARAGDGRGALVSLEAVLDRVRRAEAAAGRAPGSVRLVAVTKGHGLPEIEAQVLAPARRLGLALPLGENRGQELRDKARALQEQGQAVEWHFIGPLQLNKIKYLRPVSLVHTIENLAQAQEIARLAQGWGRAPELLLQLHNGEAQKHGLDAAEVDEVYHQSGELGLSVRGLMVMAPYADPAAARRVFESAAREAARLGLSELSMGMSDDLECAVACGATLVRPGRALFAPA